MWRGSSTFQVRSPTVNRAMHSPRLGHTQRRVYVTEGPLQIVTLRADSKYKHTRTVIFLHGLGDTAHGWVDLVDMMRPSVPHVKFILPTAPQRPVTLNNNMVMNSWFDILDLQRLQESCDGLEDTRVKVSQIIEDEIKSGIPSNRILLGGFSQGGSSSIYIGYTHPKQLAGVLALSCFIPSPKTFENELNVANKNTPLLMCHGEEDTMVIQQVGKMAFNKLKSLGINGNWKSYADLGHSPNEQVIKDSVAFILRCLPSLHKL